MTPEGSYIDIAYAGLKHLSIPYGMTHKLSLSKFSFALLSLCERKNILPYARANKQISDWMEEKEFDSIEEFRGKMAQKNIAPESMVYKRAQYVDLLMRSDNIFGD